MCRLLVLVGGRKVEEGEEGEEGVWTCRPPFRRGVVMAPRSRCGGSISPCLLWGEIIPWHLLLCCLLIL